MKLNKSIQVKFSSQPKPYDVALAYMQNHLNLMKTKDAEELIWFLEHENVYTAGTSANEEDQQIKNKNLIRYT